MPDSTVQSTAIPGLLVFNLQLHEDDRGWFKENWNAARLRSLGLTHFEPVQHNVSFNAVRGVTRGFHAEPWSKLVSVTSGSVFGAWIDLRPGADFGRVVTHTITPGTLVYVPRGVANACQSLEPHTSYSYLVDQHQSLDARERTSYVALDDPELGVDWPVPFAEAVTSEADKMHPPLSEARPARAMRPLILGGGGILARALSERLPDALVLTRRQVDLGSPESLDAVDFRDVSAIYNAAAYTDADGAETPDGRMEAWRTNVTGVAHLTRKASHLGIPLVHVSSDYVFDGRSETHTEEEPVSPINVYGQTKAAGDALVLGYAHGFVLRTSWVFGDGDNFVSTMRALCSRGVSPRVVNDQFGRLTFAGDLADAAIHLVNQGQPAGLYNVTNAGPTQSWADIAGDVFEMLGAPRERVTPVSTAEYFAGKSMAPRPRHSTLALNKLAASGFEMPSAADRLRSYLR